MTVEWNRTVNEIVWESQTAPGITWTTVVGGTSTGTPANRLVPTGGDPETDYLAPPETEGELAQWKPLPASGGSFPTYTNPISDPPTPSVDGESWMPSDAPQMIAFAAGGKWRGGWFAIDSLEQTAINVDPGQITLASTNAPGFLSFGSPAGLVFGLSLGFWLLEGDPRTGSGFPGSVGSVVWSATVGSWLRKTGASATAWEAVGGGASVDPSDDDPEALGAADPGTSDEYSRGDHVHPLPTPADIGAAEQGGNIDGSQIQTGTVPWIHLPSEVAEESSVASRLAGKVPTSRTLADLDLSANRTAAELRAALGLIVVRKSADETVNNSATLQDDDHLAVTVEASKSYRFRAVLGFGGDSAADVKFQLVGPSGSSAVLMVFGPGTGTGGGDAGLTSAGTGIVTVGLATNIAFGCGGSGSGTIRRWSAIIEGIVTTSTTAGTLKLQWAQNVQTAADTRVFAGSFLDLQEVA